MERADVRVTDWRGDWVRHHRLLNAIGVLACAAASLPVFVTAAFTPMRPESSLGPMVFLSCLGALLLGLAINYLPWKLRSSGADGGEQRWPAR